MRTDADQRFTLIFDGDDTLWENNVYFERAIDEFIAYLDHSSLTAPEVRAVLDEIERANTKLHGYGSAVFGQSLRECYEHLMERDIDEPALSIVMGFAERLRAQPMELIAGVEATLDELGARHDLMLLTKGHAEEQRLKIERSGLEGVFDRTFVVPEKDVAVYRRVIDQIAAAPARTWMIGNSPRSDINPALAAGLNAVFIPHDQTWSLEHDELASGPGRLLLLVQFADLLEHL